MIGSLAVVYLNNRVFLSRNYRRIVAKRKIDVVKNKNKYLSEKRSFEGKYASFKNIKFPRGNYQKGDRDRNTLLSLLLATKFSSARAHSKTWIFNYCFLTFRDKRLEGRNVSNETKPDKKLTEYNRQNKTGQETD